MMNPEETLHFPSALRSSIESCCLTVWLTSVLFWFTLIVLMNVVQHLAAKNPQIFKKRSKVLMEKNVLILTKLSQKCK